MKGGVLVIAGEHSGDARAAEIIAALRPTRPDLPWFGVGGPLMRAQGVETRYDIDDMDVMGIGEVLRRYPFFKRVFNEVLAWADARQPELVLLVDYPGFNLRLARKLHAKGFKVVFYICPQVWAWNRGRIPKMAECLDHLLTIFPFEHELFVDTHLPVTYVGHPLVDSIEAFLKQPSFPLPWNHAMHRIALLPGSRPQEIDRLIPVMLSAATLLDMRIPDCTFLVAAAGKKQEQQILDLLAEYPTVPPGLSVVPAHTRDIIAQADAAMVCSGTATLETALLGCPMVVCYKTSLLTYCLMRPFIRVPNIGMVNIVAGRQICPECIQRDATPGNLAQEIEAIVRPGTRRLDMLHDLTDVKNRMGVGGAAANAAAVLQGFLAPTTDGNSYNWQ